MSELYIVSTPIGNLSDITLRAVEIMKKADFIICEDTRVSGRLLSHYSIETKLVLYNDHNKKRAAERIIKMLQNSQSGAMITDAGTPCISDPGYYLINKCIENGINVLSVPGPSALTAALSISGLPTDRFIFHGFVPRKKNARRSVLSDAVHTPITSVFYESPYRIDKTLNELSAINSKTSIALCREMTKMHEECIRGSVHEVLNSKWKRKGELVLIIKGERQ